ncbi:MAG: hypothetical protein HY272_11025 [Gammaproteobacteria bacterium]|nr:hypothetical protein [Gammaproteobacteria bacterium]
MKKIIALVSAAALLSAFAMPTMAAPKKSAEEVCKTRAEKKQIAADKMDEFVKSCVEKHNKSHHKAKHNAPAN